MKKLVMTTLILTAIGTTQSLTHAAGTYTEAVTQKYTQKAVDKETQIRQEAAARQDVRAQEAQKRIDKVNETQQKVETKKQLLRELVGP